MDCRLMHAPQVKSTETPRPLEAVNRPVPHVETAAEAIAALDAQFAWLRGADKPISKPRWRPS